MYSLLRYRPKELEPHKRGNFLNNIYEEKKVKVVKNDVSVGFKLSAFRVSSEKNNLGEKNYQLFMDST